MLTRLQLKNWRTLRDVEITSLQAITVFVGANSSGKTNLLDALYFLRQAAQGELVQGLLEQGVVYLHFNAQTRSICLHRDYGNLVR